MVKSNCHRVEVLLQLQTELDVILALKKKAVRCLKSIKTSGTGETAALTEAQPAHRGKRLSFFTQHSLDNIYNTVSGFGTPTQLINPSEFSRGPQESQSWTACPEGRGRGWVAAPACSRDSWGGTGEQPPREIMEEPEPGSSQLCLLGGRGTTGTRGDKRRSGWIREAMFSP